LSHCSIIGKNNKKRNKHLEIFLIEPVDKNSIGLDSDTLLKMKRLENKKPWLEINNCFFLNCLSFVKDLDLIIRNSIIRYTVLSDKLSKPIKLFNGRVISVTGAILFISANSNNSIELEGCLIESKINEFSSLQHFLYASKVTNCIFRNLYQPLCMTHTDIIIRNTIFINCWDAINSFFPRIEITDCLFQNCYGVIKGASKIMHCQFIECGNSIIRGENGIKIEECDFVNIQNPDEKNYNPSFIGSGSNWGISLLLDKLDGKQGDNQALISNCNFDGINHAGFIRFSFDKELSIFSKKLSSYTIKDCTFNHCVTGIIDKNNYRYDFDSDVAIKIINCTGLDKGDGGQAENHVIRKETANGEPIGTEINEKDVGVPLYQTT
jgi:hypothetical protein